MPEIVAKVLPFDELRELAKDDRHVASDLRAMEDILETSPGEAWLYAREAGHRISALNDVRIIQILDEFQYLNRWIVSDHNGEVENLCYSYMGAAESKVSPQIVAGSYIGWLGASLRHMTGRYREWRLEGLRDEEALAAVYNYARVFQMPITDETAPYIAEVTDNDPFYIAATISNRPEEKDLTTKEGVRAALALETIAGKGEIARVWNEYLWDAFARVNDTNARKIVLYLAAHEPEERGRDQILSDLGLDMTDQGLEERLHKLVKADFLADVVTNPQERLTLDCFTTIRKARFYLDQEKSVEADRYAGRLHAVSERDDGTDLIVEVKAWDRELPPAAVTPFIEAKETLGSHLGRKTAFLFYSEGGLGQEAAAMLARAGIMIVDVAKLASYELPALSAAGPGTPFLE